MSATAPWPPLAEIERLLRGGLSFSQIADAHGTTKGLIAGLVWRYGLSPDGIDAELGLRRREAYAAQKRAQRRDARQVAA
jgi:hypothetical protein